MIISKCHHDVQYERYIMGHLISQYHGNIKISQFIWYFDILQSRTLVELELKPSDDCRLSYDTAKDTSPVGLLARAPAFGRSSALRGFLLIDQRQDCRLRPTLSHCLNIREYAFTYRSVTQSPSPPKICSMFHFLSSIYRTSFPFFLFSTAASLVSNFYSVIP